MRGVGPSISGHRGLNSETLMTGGASALAEHPVFDPIPATIINDDTAVAECVLSDHSEIVQLIFV